MGEIPLTYWYVCVAVFVFFTLMFLLFATGKNAGRHYMGALVIAAGWPVCLVFLAILKLYDLLEHAIDTLMELSEALGEPDG
jgi:hypothetical protein